jgi:hypothetical protein
MGWFARLTGGIAASLVLTLALSGCAGPVSTAPPKPPPAPRGSVVTTEQVEAVALMKKYDLHPVGSPQVTQELLRESDLVSLPSFRASKVIGLDLNAHIGERLTLMSYLLRERSQAREGTITANFYVARGHVVGAWLTLRGYIGGGPALSEHDQFMPPGVYEPGRVRLEHIRSVEIITQDGSAIIRDASAINRLSALIASSRPAAADGLGADDIYDILFTHDNGAVTDVRIDRPQHGGRFFMKFIGLESMGGTYLDPAPGLVAYLDKLTR